MVNDCRTLSTALSSHQRDRPLGFDELAGQREDVDIGTDRLCELSKYRDVDVGGPAPSFSA